MSKVKEYIEFNPTERLSKGLIAKKIAMDKIQPYCRQVSGFELEEYKGGTKFRNGDTVMARITPCLENGKTAKISILDDGEVAFGSTEFIILRAKPGICDPDFAYYLSISPKFREAAIKSMTGSSGRQRVQQKAVEDYEYDFPSLETQRRIAAILSSLDDKIELNNEINRNLEQQIQSLYKSWFVDYEPFDREKPALWPKADIYSIANIIYGAPFSSKLFNAEKDGVPIIRIRDLKEQDFVTYTTEKHPKGYLLKPADIVVGMDGEFRPYLWGNSSAWLNQRVCVFENRRPKGKAFLLYTLKPLLYKIEQTQVATTVIHIGKKDFDKFEFTLPDNDTLKAFDEITHPMIQQIVSNKLENKKLAALRDALLPRLMSGELDVSDVEI